jgi:hypothetical protein
MSLLGIVLALVILLNYLLATIQGSATFIL